MGANLIISGSSGTDYIYQMLGISGTVEKQFASPATYPYGLAVNDDGDLISVDNTQTRIYVHSGITGVIDRQFGSPEVEPRGIIIYNGNLISCNSTPARIYLHKGITSEIESEFPAPASNCKGLTVANGNLVSSDTDYNRIYVHNGLTSDILYSFATPGSFCNSLAFDGVNLISLDNGTDLIYIHDGVSGVIQDTFAPPNTTSNGITVWFGELTQDDITPPTTNTGAHFSAVNLNTVNSNEAASNTSYVSGTNLGKVQSVEATGNSSVLFTSRPNQDIPCAAKASCYQSASKEAYPFNDGAATMSAYTTAVNVGSILRLYGSGLIQRFIATITTVGFDDLIVPMKTLQVSRTLIDESTNEVVGVITISIPGTDFLDAIADRVDGTLIINSSYQYKNVEVYSTELVRGDIEEIREDTGGRNKSVTIQAREYSTYASGVVRNIEKVTYRSTYSGKTTLRSDINPDVRPNDTITFGAETFVCSKMSIYVAKSVRQMEVTG